MTVEVTRCQEGMLENMETICRHWWFSQVEDKCTLFQVVCSCITGPDKCNQVGFHSKTEGGAVDEVEEVQLLLHGLKPAPQPLLHPLQLCSVPLCPHNGGEQIPAINANIVS